MVHERSSSYLRTDGARLRREHACVALTQLERLRPRACHGARSAPLSARRSHRARLVGRAFDAVILMFSAIVPSTRTETLLAGLVTASMNPGMLWARAQGYWDFGPASNALLMHYPDYLLVGVAVVISHVVTTLGRQVAKAREMGSYHLGELLGRGGMGEVYKASHRMLARPAAIKLTRPEMLGGSVQLRTTLPETGPLMLSPNAKRSAPSGANGA